jgi:hypothetical protein
VQSPRTVTETVLIVNDGQGQLFGRAWTDTPWITILTPFIHTDFIQYLKIRIQAEMIPPSSPSGEVHITSNGGSVLIRVESSSLPVQRARLLVKEKNLHFRLSSESELLYGEICIQNIGLGLLSGTATPQVSWIRSPLSVINTSRVQIIPFIINPAAVPSTHHPVGIIRIQTSGGDERVEISLHHSPLVPRFQVYPKKI